MPYTDKTLPDAVKALPEPAQRQWLAVFNAQAARGLKEERAFASAWAALANSGWRKNAKTGTWEHHTRMKEAAWDAAFINMLPDTSFAVISGGGSKDDMGRTVPRSLRHLPYKDASGKVDLSHLRNALARLDQTELTAAEKATARQHLDAAAKAAKIGDFREAQGGPRTGVMVALYPDPDLATLVAIPGGEAPEELHLTLAYLGHIDEIPADVLARLPEIVQAFSVLAYPLEGVVSGVGRFLGDRTSEGRDVFYLTLDLPALPEWQHELIDTLEDQGIPCHHDHGFTPHVTLAYLDPGTPSPAVALQPYPLRFASVHLIMGDEHRVYALRGTDGRMTEAWSPGQLRLAPGRLDLAYAVLLSADTHEYTKEVIAKSAHDWYARVPLTEQTLTGRADLHIVESFLAPSGCELAGHPVAEGSWVIAVLGDAELGVRRAAGEDLRVNLEGTAWTAERPA